MTSNLSFDSFNLYYNNISNFKLNIENINNFFIIELYRLSLYHRLKYRFRKFFYL